jgi:hypothetical protein
MQGAVDGYDIDREFKARETKHAYNVQLNLFVLEQAACVETTWTCLAHDQIAAYIAYRTVLMVILLHGRSRGIVAVRTGRIT